MSHSTRFPHSQKRKKRNTESLKVRLGKIRIWIGKLVRVKEIQHKTHTKHLIPVPLPQEESGHLPVAQRWEACMQTGKGCIPRQVM